MAQAREVDQERRTYDQETQELIVALMEGQAEKRNDLLEIHENEKFELNRQWRSIRRARLYNRPSKRVALLRHQQTFLAV
jgi:hypothetical protein